MAGIGTHLAALNLFREADGSLHITVAGATPACIASMPDAKARPIDYVEGLIVEAARGMAERIGATPIPNPLREKATALRTAQRAYMADRGNEALGQAVARAAAELDAVLEVVVAP